MKQRHFQRVRQNSQRRAGSFLVIDIRHGRGSQPKLGICASRKFGKSHIRNRFKRCVREAFRLSKHLFTPHVEVVVKPRTRAATATSKEIQQELCDLLKPEHAPILLDVV